MTEEVTDAITCDWRCVQCKFVYFDGVRPDKCDCGCSIFAVIAWKEPNMRSASNSPTTNGDGSETLLQAVTRAITDAQPVVGYPVDPKMFTAFRYGKDCALAAARETIHAANLTPRAAPNSPTTKERPTSDATARMAKTLGVDFVRREKWRLANEEVSEPRQTHCADPDCTGPKPHVAETAGCKWGNPRAASVAEVGK